MVEVFRDAQGVPHLRADSVDELARLQGRVVAQDRAWQIEWNRRRAEGRTAEIIGAPGLTFDRFARRAGIDRVAQRCFDNLDDRTQTWVSAFTEGVNTGLADGASGAYEFDSLDIGPGTWQPWSPLALFAVQQLIFGGFAYKLWRRHVSRRLGADVVDLLDSEIPDAIGSNAWVVTGRRTASGKPIIAGDPHRQADFPGVYQQVRLACPEFDVFGFTFAGVPGVQHFAHTGRVAWAITNAMSDYQDLFEEQLDRSGAEVTARGPSGPEPVQRRIETISVRGGTTEQLEVLVTRRGPVIVDGETGPPSACRRRRWSRTISASAACCHCCTPATSTTFWQRWPPGSSRSTAGSSPTVPAPSGTSLPAGFHCGTTGMWTCRCRPGIPAMPGQARTPRCRSMWSMTWRSTRTTGQAVGVSGSSTRPAGGPAGSAPGSAS
ncbi:hypothetical protein GJV80_12340 [Microlunatus sp. Gsoil 973]|nr:hypothetical protein GJV80_12340 [Microlunatus sp. Gsoil 973]